LEVYDQNRNEVKEYLDSRYITAAESCWHIFEFSMHNEYPSVTRLPVHLENQQLIYYNEDEDLDAVVERGAQRHTALTAWFLKSRDANDLEARRILYQDFPKRYSYNKKTQKWEKCIQSGPAIGRMHFASPNQGERFYLRLLLTVVSGAQSFADLRTVDGHIWPTFKEACLAKGLLEDDREWNQCLVEAREMQTGTALRSLFAVILLSCVPSSPEVLWDWHL
jgi:hypothetical protein